MNRGMVYITGAGPGDEGLITVRGLETIRAAQVLVYDRLAGAALVEQAPEHCEKIYVGKESSNHTMTQDEINELLFKKALEGKVVTRLKGGDPYVFGRGGEEALYLEERSIPYEVVPGITSGIGGLAYSGIPITHRDFASSFHIITGHLKEEDQELDWETLARLKGTLVFYMGMAQLETISGKLVEQGMEKDTPVALVQWATTAKQRTVTGTLETIVEVAKREKMTSPVLIVVGKVVELRNQLNFYERKPLLGKRILVTRARAQSSKLSEQIRRLGGEALEFPLIRIEKTVDPSTFHEILTPLDAYTWVVFTSQNGVDAFFEALWDAGKDARSLGTARIAAVGSATGEALKGWGLRADLIPERFVAESLLEGLIPLLGENEKFLLVQGEQARTLLGEELARFGALKVLHVYHTVKESQGASGDLIGYLAENPVDAITFASSSTVDHLVEVLNKDCSVLQGIPLISMGPITSETMKTHGLDIAKEASPHNLKGLMDALLEGVKRG